MQHSETIGKISAALSKAQGLMATAAKSEKGNFGKYADLASIWEACREPLAKNEIAVIQAPGEAAEKVMTLTTILSHSSGEYFRETLTIPMSKIDAQGYGSACTYARRYALAAMVGIAPAEDDGQAAAAIGAVENNAPRRAAPKADPVPAPPVEPERDWAAWALELAQQLANAKKPGEVEIIRTREDANIKAAGKADRAIYNSVGKAFTDARDRLAITQEKEPA